jgi:hypothetical protein
MGDKECHPCYLLLFEGDIKMKIGGKEVTGPNEEILVLPRLGGEIVIKAIAVTNVEEFEKLVPEPKAPGRLTKDGWVPQVDDKTYRQRLAEYNQQRFAFLVVNSLVPSQIEWSTVQLDNPQTWMNWRKELKDAGFADVEINRITLCVMQANALDENKLREARELFLRGMAAEAQQLAGHPTEQENMQSGEPVNG